jgi:hypothetical protein
MTTISPTTFAEAIADQLAGVLRSIHLHYTEQVGPAIAAAVDQRDFDRARQIMADAEYIIDVAEQAVRAIGMPSGPRPFSDAIGSLVSELVDTAGLDEILEDIDPERLANADRMVAELRESGNWTDEEEADRQLDTITRAAKYPEPQR